MSDGSVNFNKLSFFQKVELAKENLTAQGKTSPSTADIVKEMVNLEKAAKADALPDGFQIEQTNTRRASDLNSNDIANATTQELYGPPDVNRNAMKILEMLKKILNNENLSSEAKTEATAILTEMLSLITATGNIPDGLIALIDDMANDAIIITQPEVLYGPPNVDPRANTLIDFFSRMSSNNAIPNDIKQVFMDILSNPENVGGGEKSAASLLIDTLMKLAEDSNIPRDVLRAIADIINTMSQEGAFADSATNKGELVKVIVTDDEVIIETSQIVEMLYAAPDPKSEVYKKFLGFCQKIMASDLPQEIKEMVLELLQNPSDIGTAASSVEELVLKTIKQLIDSGKLSEDDIAKILDIANSLGIDVQISIGTDLPRVVYGPPDINPLIENPNVKVLLDFLNKLMSSAAIPDDIKAKMRELLNNIGDAAKEDVLVAEILIDAVNKLISENNIDEDIMNEILNIIKELDFNGAEELSFQEGSLIYDTPEIRNKKLFIVLDIIEKLNSSTNIPDGLKQELFALLSDILHSLKDEELSSNIDNVLHNLKGVDTTGAEKHVMNKNVDIESKFPSNKYNIKKIVSLNATTIMVIVEKK